MEIKTIEDGDNIVTQVTRKLMYQVAKNEEEETKMAIVDYAKKNNAELVLLDEETVKTIIDLGCKEYLKGHKSGYISKDKIREKIEEKEKQKEEVPHEMDFRAFYRISDLKEVEIGALKELLEE